MLRKPSEKFYTLFYASYTGLLTSATYGMMETLKWFIVFSMVVSSGYGYMPWECPTELLEQDRIDCMPDEPASEPACYAK